MRTEFTKSRLVAWKSSDLLKTYIADRNHKENVLKRSKGSRLSLTSSTRWLGDQMFKDAAAFYTATMSKDLINSPEDFLSSKLMLVQKGLLTRTCTRARIPQDNVASEEVFTKYYTLNCLNLKPKNVG